MKENRIDISSYTSNHIDEYRDIDFDYVITVCDHAKEHCPYVPAKVKKFHYNFTDPAKATGTDEEIYEQFRQVRNQIKEYCERFVIENLSYPLQGLLKTSLKEKLKNT